MSDDENAVASVLGSDDLLSRILHYAISHSSEVPTMAVIAHHWNDNINKNPKTATSLWRNICAAQEPDILRIYNLCQESNACAAIAGSGWRMLLYRSLRSCYTPWGSNIRLQKSLELVFFEEGISAFSNCCDTDYCCYSYNSCSRFSRREKGIVFFRLYLNGVNYDPSRPLNKVYVLYSDLNYVLENWEAECDIIRRWCAVLGVTRYTVEKPSLESISMRVVFGNPVVLEGHVVEDEEEVINADEPAVNIYDTETSSIQRPRLRFSVGQRVLCFVDRGVDGEIWAPGTVRGLWVECMMPNWPEPVTVPYGVILDDGSSIIAPQDTNGSIRELNTDE
jgi:hypothetical protein